MLGIETLGQGIGIIWDQADGLLHYINLHMKHTASTHSTIPRRQEVLTGAVLNAAEIMGLNQATLARVLGISTASVSRMKAGSLMLKEGTKTWELATMLLRLFRSLDAIVAGDERSMRLWLTGYNTALNDAPVDLIVSAQGLARTLSYVDAHRVPL